MSVSASVISYAPGKRLLLLRLQQHDARQAHRGSALSYSLPYRRTQDWRPRATHAMQQAFLLVIGLWMLGLCGTMMLILTTSGAEEADQVHVYRAIMAEADSQARHRAVS
jgi:hypothetical protein